jgi:hypothetical protein
VIVYFLTLVYCCSILTSVSTLSGATNQASHRVVAAVVGVLPPGLKVELVEELDGDSHLVIHGRSLIARWVSRGWPREVRAAIARQPLADVIVAPYLSPGAREAVRASRVAWVDEFGGAEVSLPWLVIERSGSKPRKAVASRWRNSTLAISEALLSGVRPTVRDICRATGCSTRTAQVGLSLLESDGLLASEVRRGPRSQRRIVDPSQLLEAYTEAASGLDSPERLEVGISWRNPRAALRASGAQWKALGLQWAATGAIAADLIAPLLTTISTAEVFVDVKTRSQLLESTRMAGLEPLVGGRLILRPFPSVGTRNLATEIDGLFLAPWPRVFVDLRRVGVRGEEAAEHLRSLKLPQE